MGPAMAPFRIRHEWADTRFRLVVRYDNGAYCDDTGVERLLNFSAMPEKPTGRLWKWAKWILGLILATVFLFLFVAAPLLLSAAVVNRRFQFRDPLRGKTPSDLGMPYEEIAFPSPPDLTLRGWYIPGDPGQTAVIFCHGLNRSRVEMLPQARFVHSLGFSAMLFDFRHHGDSTGARTTLGAKEKDDVLAAAAWIRQRRPESGVMLWGISMGATSAMLAARVDREIRGIISDSSFLSFRDVIDHHFRLFFGLPPWPIADEVRALMEWRGSFRGDDIDVLQAARDLGTRPAMFVGQDGDLRVPPTIARQLFVASASPVKRLLILRGERHGHAYADHLEQYQQAVIEFLNAAGLIGVQ